jgi:hypothetical protein
MKGIYEKNYSGSIQVVLQFCSLLGNQSTTEMVIAIDATKVLNVYWDILTYSMGKELQLFMSFPVKHSFTMSNILIDKTAIQDLILDDKGGEMRAKYEELYTVVQQLVNKDPKSTIHFVL